MEWTDITITVAKRDSDTAEAIATMVANGGIYIEDYSDLEQQAWEIAHVDLIEQELLDKPRDVVIIHTYLSPDENPAEVLPLFEERLKASGIRYQLGTAGVQQEDWQNAWKAYYHATDIGQRLAIVPSWESYDTDRTVITMDPGLAFGTGTHETTSMCMQLLEKHLQEGMRVMDVGTGSGILAIAAARLGAREVLAIDIDPAAVKVARENIALNHVQDRVRAVEGDLCKSEAMPCALAVANIVADAIRMLAAPLTRHLKKGGLLICSGIIREREQDVLEAALAAGYAVADRLEKGEWVALALRNEAA